MSFLRRFEAAVEKGVQGTFAKVFRSSLKPVDITSAVRKAMEQDVQEFSRDHVVAPNHFTVRVSNTDFKSLQEIGLDVLSAEIEATATRYAAENDYSLLGPVSVDFELGADELTGHLEVDTQLERGAVAPATSQVASEYHPIIDIDGQRWLLTEPVTVIGRGTDADITIADAGISRKHLELRKTPDGVIATDLGSTNGLYVEGHKVDAATLVDGNQLVIGRTRILFWTSESE
ncbi:FHA domain protein [Gleimia coleocanis DSM 15436]|uniref:FHA domain protein n=1 Tax=Gleimia coleocanis DSM 15436 TaxID=525245 RepID=C0VY26_9ACTO|nr:DUF3662 and FHA domain-containing protein [Gleimia coleocanis]EEH64329.1 FHA domain protein [Gleimia coleocanis DSM 15436]